MKHLHDKGKALAQSVHKLDEKPLLLPSAEDLHNLCHLVQQYRLILCKSAGEKMGKSEGKNEKKKKKNKVKSEL